MRPIALAAATLLALLALAQLLRIVLRVEVTVGGVIVPMWASGLASLVAGAVALMLCRKTLSADGAQPKIVADQQPNGITLSTWLTEKQQKPVEVWREILGQLRQLSTDVWNGVRFFVTVNAVVIGAAFSVANQKPRDRFTAVILFALGLLGLLFTVATRRILKRQRNYYLDVLAQKALFEEDVGLYDIRLAGTATHLSVPWNVERVHLQDIKQNTKEWRRARARARGTVTRNLFLIYDAVLIVYIALLLTLGGALYKGVFRSKKAEPQGVSTPSSAALEPTAPRYAVRRGSARDR